jgi:hypothetical protein
MKNKLKNFFSRKITAEEKVIVISIIILGIMLYRVFFIYL